MPMFSRNNSISGATSLKALKKESLAGAVFAIFFGSNGFVKYFLKENGLYVHRIIKDFYLVFTKVDN